MNRFPALCLPVTKEIKPHPCPSPQGEGFCPNKLLISAMTNIKDLELPYFLDLCLPVIKEIKFMKL